MSYRNINNPYSKFTNKDNDIVSNKTFADKSISIDFFNIVISGDVSKLNEFVNNKGNYVINLLNDNGENALHIILKSDLSELNKLNMIKYLISKKILLENRNKMGETPLLVATKKNHKSIIIELVNNGANIQNESSLGITPLHYLAKGMVVSCEKTNLEQIIDNPKPKHDKKEISELAKDVRKFYNDELIPNWVQNLNAVDGNTLNPYPERLIKFLEHTKSAADKVLENNPVLQKGKEQITDEINKILVDTTKSEEEKKLELEKVRSNYYNAVYKEFKKIDSRFDQNVDLKPSVKLDETGIVLPDILGNPPFEFNVHGASTLNQILSQSIPEKREELIQLSNSINNSITALDATVGSGVTKTCENLASYFHTINFYHQIYRLNEFINANRIDVANLYTINNPAAINLAANQALDDIKQRININTNEIVTPNFNEKYFMQYAGANTLDITTQNQYNALHDFDENKMNAFNLDNNNITSQNLISNGNEIIINLSNFNWNVFPVAGGAPQHFTLSIKNKISKFTTYISRDFLYDNNTNQNNILRTNRYDNFIRNQNHLKAVPGANPNLGNVPAPNGRNSQPRVRKLLRFRIRKLRQNTREQNSSTNNIALSLDYVDFNGNQRTIEFGEGQFNITFLSTNNVAVAGGLIVAGADADLVSLQTFDLSDFSTDLTNYTQFFDSHNLVQAAPPVAAGQRQFTLLPILALINEIKEKNIKSRVTASFINENGDLNQGNIQRFYNRLHKYYKRYYETLRMYSQEFFIGKNQQRKIDKILNNVAFKNNLSNSLYNDMYQNLVNNKVNIMNDINEELSNIRNQLNMILQLSNRFFNSSVQYFDMYNIYQYFNEQSDNFDRQHWIEYQELFKNELLSLDDEAHFGSSDGVTVTNTAVVNKVGISQIYFGKYSQNVNGMPYLLINNFVQQNQNIPLNPKIRFINNVPGPNNRNFTNVAYNPRAIPGYFVTTRYRMLEEIVLTINSLKGAEGPYKEIYDRVEEHVNKLKIQAQIKEPLILSIIGDLVDNLLISNIKKVLKDSVNEKVGTIMATNDMTAIQLSTQPTSNYQVNFQAIEYNKNFGVNLGELDSIVEKALNKITTLDEDRLLELSFGDILISNMAKRNYKINDKNVTNVQQIFYPVDFLSTYNVEPKCIIYDDEIMKLIDQQIININKKDFYGNAPLFYALESQNYLFAKKLIEKNAKILNIRNKDDKNAIHFVLDKLENICNFFGNNKNIIEEINNYYTIELKEEIKKLDNHKNVMKNVDKLVLLYLFLLNSSFFNEMYTKNHNLLQNFKEIYENNTDYNLFDSDNYQNDFAKIFVNPIKKIIDDSAKSPDVQVQSRYPKLDILVNLEEKLKKEIAEKDKKLELIEQNIANYTKIQELLNEDAYQTNVEDNKKKYVNQLIAIRQEIRELRNKLKLAQTDIAYTGTYQNVDLGFSNILDEIIDIASSFKNTTLKDFSFSPFLKALDKANEDPNFYNNSYFFHHLMSKIICQFVNNSKSIISKKLINVSDIITINLELKKITELMKKTMYLNILDKNNNVRNIDKNEGYENEFNRICFTVDAIVGDTFYKVLKRLLMTFLKTRYPPSDENADKFLQFIENKVNSMLSEVKKYITADINNNITISYTPSRLTKILVLINGNYKSNEEYSESNENEIFEYIKNLIMNNGFEEISEDEPIIKYLQKIFLPYFINYYRICITKLINATKSYENLILNQFHNLSIVEMMTDHIITREQSLPSGTSLDLRNV